MPRLLALLIILLTPLHARPQAHDTIPLPLRAANGAIHIAETLLDALTITRPKLSLALYPAASYSSRSGLAIGIMPMLQLHPARLPQPITITPSALVSTKHMFEVQCDADIFFNNNLDLTLKFESQHQPDDLYSIGNQTHKLPIAQYNYSRQLLTADLLKGLPHHPTLRLGLSIDFDHYSFSHISPTPSDSLTALTLTTSSAGHNLGIGLTLGIDSRDNTLWPTRGSYSRLRLLAYSRLSHATPYAALSLDARRYLPIRSSTLALQAFADLRLGHDIPFPKLATCAGTRLGRAIGHNLKYLDRAAWLAQAEFRAPLFWRIGGTLFTAIGNVTHTPAALLSHVHLMCGAGLRLAVFPGKGLNLRLDAGLSQRGDKAIYFNIREAF